MKKVLITGTAGFIGFHLVKCMVDYEYNIIGYDNINDYYDVNLKYARLKETGIEKDQIKYGKKIQSSLYHNYHFIKANLEDRILMEKLFKKERFDIVVNLAAQAGVRYSIENPFSYVESNLVGFINILECCRHNNIKHLVYASSSSVYGNNDKIPFSEEDRVDYPVSLYAATKKANELMAHTYSHLYQLPSTGLRFFTVYGPWGRPDMAPMIFAKAIRCNKSINIYNNGNLSRDFTYISDIIQGLVCVINNKPKEDKFAHVYNIGYGHPIQLIDFIRIMEKKMSKIATKIMLPMQNGDVYQTYACTSKLEQDFNYKPKIGIEEGLTSFINWYLSDNNPIDKKVCI